MIPVLSKLTLWQVGNVPVARVTPSQQRTRHFYASVSPFSSCSLPGLRCFATLLVRRIISSRWVGLLRTHLLLAIIDIDSLCIYPPSHQVAYHRTLHEWTRFDTCRSLHRQSLRTITYDIVELDELRDCPTYMILPYLDGPFQFHDVAAVEIS